MSMGTFRARVVRRWLPLIVVASLVLAACGGADTTSTTAASQETAGTSAATTDAVAETTASTPGTESAAPETTGGGSDSPEGEPIVFGGALPLTGWGSDAGELNHRGYQLWEKQVNESGGILGRPVELLIYDDQSDPTTTGRLYERLITQDNVDVLLAPWSDDMTMPATNVAEQHGKPMVTGGATLTDIWDRGYKYVTGLLPSSYDYVGVAVRLLEGQVESAAVLNADLTYTTGFGDAGVENIEDLGMTLTGREAYADGTQNFAPIIAAIADGEPDLLVGGTGGANDAIQIVQASKIAGFSPDMFYFTIAPVEPEFVEVLGEDAEYVLGTTEWEPSLEGLPGFEEFVTGYEEMFGEEPVEDAATAYGLATVLQEAIESVGELDDDKINDELHTMEITTVFGDYSVDPETGMQTGKAIYVLQIQDGERHIVWPEDVATAELIFPTPAWSER
ncbi:MAG: ABC transporter substrate-binding protein [Acidimicrobiia bacterium]|nr:ABC transporter substrate-binding protein [Acidimicrobiia bacterium]